MFMFVAVPARGTVTRANTCQVGELPPLREVPGLTKTQRHRQRALYELVQTERDYVNDIRVLMDVRCSVAWGVEVSVTPPRWV